MTGFYTEYDDTSGVHVSSAETAAAAALASKNAAAASATDAASSESNAASSKTSAATSATNAATSETNAATSATNAATSATTASTKAGEADSSASNAATSETAAATSAINAATSATNAASSATAATTAETNAETAETNAETAETNAASSATASASSASTASTQATNASNSASAAATSATNAGNSATAAATSETNAASSATSASGSATTATTKAGEAATSATNAATSETNAATSATNSANSATSAGTAQTAAEAARDAALAAFDSFDDRYLGQKSSDPTVDNDGDALVAGALYFNTTDDVMKVYEGSVWVAAYASLSGALLSVNNLSDLNNSGAARTNLGLGTAATTAASAYASAAQGTTADAALPKAGGAMSGAITTNSTFDGRDVAADGTKLDGIATGATNVTNNNQLTNGAGYVTTDTNTTYTAGSGLSLTGTVFANTAPDQTVALTGSGATSVSGTYPNFTITSTDTTYSVGDGGLTQINFTSADNTKLDGIETGATADQTAAEILTAIKTVDGSGSGLDADTVDGLHEGSFMRRSANSQLDMNNFDILGVDQIFHEGDSNTYMQFHAADQWRVVTGGVERLEINNTQVTVAGNMVVSGTLSVRTAIDLADNDILRFGTSDDVEFFCNGSHMYMDLNAGIGNFYIRDTTTTRFTFDDAGHFTATGNITAYSDIRLKEDIKPIEDAVSKVQQLTGNTYTRNDLKDADRRYGGVIAQEVEFVLPEAVSESEDGTKTVDYNAMIALLVESIKELKAEVDDLKAQLEAK